MFVRWFTRGRNPHRLPRRWRGRAIFISYRRSGASFASGWLRDRLVARLGTEGVIRDVNSIAGGTSFVDFIRAVIPECRAVVAIIDPEWSVASASAECRYTMLPGDMVAYELERAFEAGIKVIPLLIRGASMPAPAALPESLRWLSQLQAIELRPDRNFDDDLDSVLAAAKAP